jgi:undecaprenyl-diphosphatase
MSFPSGHAANSALVYLTIAALLTSIERDARARAYIVVTAIALTLCIGLSRLYLGVHWPSDVAAGWALGAGWAVLWRIASARFIAR